MKFNKKAPCNGCNEYLTSDFVKYIGDDESCMGVTNNTRITDVIRNIITSIKKRIVKIKSNSLNVTYNSTIACERALQIEVVPSVQPGNKLTLGSDGKLFVGNTAIDYSDLENKVLVFKKPITFEDDVLAEDLEATGGVTAKYFKVKRNGLENIVPVFRGIYSNTDTYYFNDFVSYQGKLWYVHSATPLQGSTPTQGVNWTIVVDKGQDGQSGAPSDFTEMRFAKNKTPNIPPSLSVSNPNPTGWTKTIGSVASDDIIWFTASLKKGSDNSLLENWSIPVRMTGVKGDPGPQGNNGSNGSNGAPGSDGSSGNNGIDGSEPEMRFAKNGSPTIAPSLNISDVNPTGWTITPPQISSVEYLWFTKANKRNGQLIGTWSAPVRFSGMNGSGSVSIAKFYINVFKRAATKPATPTGGSFSSPVPSGWSDFIPTGTDTVWISTRFLTEDGQSPQWPNWTSPEQFILYNTGGGGTGGTDPDAKWTEKMFSTVIGPAGTPSTIPANWFVATVSDDTSTFTWMASRDYVGEFPVTNWVITPLKFESGQIDPELIPKPYLMSFVFKRSIAAPSTPVGGTYNSPIPSGWYDGIPNGTDPLWMTNRLFSENGLAPQWTDWKPPRLVANTNTLRIKFSHEVSAPGTPSTQPSKWHDIGVTTGHSETVFDRWMAIQTVENGVTSEWNVNPIYGEGGGGTGQTGATGPAGPFAAYRGEWSGAKVYYGNSDRIEIVKYNGTYYVTRTDAGGDIPAGTYPSNNTYWNSFAGQFESIATGLLLAETAHIKNLGVSFLRTGSAGLGVPGTEHIEIFPGLATMQEFRAQGDIGYAGLYGPTNDPDYHLRNLANSIIFFGINDTGLRNKTSVDSTQLLKIQALSPDNPFSYTSGLNDDGTIQTNVTKQEGSSILLQDADSKTMMLADGFFVKNTDGSKFTTISENKIVMTGSLEIRGGLAPNNGITKVTAEGFYSNVGKIGVNAGSNQQYSIKSSILGENKNTVPETIDNGGSIATIHAGVVGISPKRNSNYHSDFMNVYSSGGLFMSANYYNDVTYTNNVNFASIHLGGIKVDSISYFHKAYATNDMIIGKNVSIAITTGSNISNITLPINPSNGQVVYVLRYSEQLLTVKTPTLSQIVIPPSSNTPPSVIRTTILLPNVSVGLPIASYDVTLNSANIIGFLFDRALNSWLIIQ